MTEDEARTRRCCGPVGCGVASAAYPERRCAGSDCMAWRWVVAPDEIGGDSDYGFVKATINWGDGVETTVARGRNIVPTGYCGLAGVVR